MKKTLLTDVFVIVIGLAMAFPVLQIVVKREVSKQMAMERAAFAKFAVDVAEVSQPALDAVANALEKQAYGVPEVVPRVDSGDPPCAARDGVSPRIPN